MTKRNHEGYLLIDHRDSPGAGPVGKGQVFEAPTFCCSHCCAVVIINPLRTRSREYCAKCNHYICDTCGAIKAATGECKTFRQIIEETQEAASLQL